MVCMLYECLVAVMYALSGSGQTIVGDFVGLKESGIFTI